MTWTYIHLNTHAKQIRTHTYIMITSTNHTSTHIHYSSRRNARSHPPMMVTRQLVIFCVALFPRSYISARRYNSERIIKTTTYDMLDRMNASNRRMTSSLKWTRAIVISHSIMQHPHMRRMLRHASGHIWDNAGQACSHRRVLTRFTYVYNVYASILVRVLCATYSCTWREFTIWGVACFETYVLGLYIHRERNKTTWLYCIYN
jgi:hypothetical protein